MIDPNPKMTNLPPFYMQVFLSESLKAESNPMVRFLIYTATSTDYLHLIPSFILFIWMSICLISEMIQEIFYTYDPIQPVQ